MLPSQNAYVNDDYIDCTIKTIDIGTKGHVLNFTCKSNLKRILWCTSGNVNVATSKLIKRGRRVKLYGHFSGSMFMVKDINSSNK